MTEVAKKAHRLGLKLQRIGIDLQLRALSSNPSDRTIRNMLGWRDADEMRRELQEVFDELDPYADTEDE